MPARDNPLVAQADVGVAGDTVKRRRGSVLVKVSLGAVAVAVIGVAAIVAGWWFFIREDAELATEPPAIPESLRTPTVGAEAPAADPTETGDAGGESGTLAFRVVPESSEAAYFADEELASVGLASTAKGATTDIEGVFYLSEDGWSMDESQTSTFTVDLTGLTSDEDRRDRRVQDALETATYPTATFTVTGISGVDASLDPAVQQTFQLVGILDLHGVQKEITWEVEARREGDVITALATTTFRFDEFGIQPPNIAGFVSVADEVTLQMQIIAQAA
jgi:polyisoprenoid-binding protein YceI